MSHLQLKIAFFQLHAAIFLAGFTGPLGRLISLNEGLLVWFRLLLSCISAWIIFSLMKKVKMLPMDDKMKLFYVGFLVALHWVFFYGSIKYANVSVGLVCFSSIGFFTAILEPVILKKKFNWIELALGLLVIVGILIIFHFDARYKTGIILGIISSLIISYAMILTGRLVRRIQGYTVLVYQLTGGLMGLSVLMPFYLLSFPSDDFLPTPNDWIWLIVLSLACTVLAFLLNILSLRRLSAFTVNLSYNLEPVYGILLAFLLFNEDEYLGKWFFTGFALIAASLIIHIIVLVKKRRNGTKPLS